MTPLILMIEDNDLDVEMIRRLLRRSGLPTTIVRARNGEEALELLLDAERARTSPGTGTELVPPFIVLLDLNMPRMGGLAFLREVRNQGLLETVPIYVLSTSQRASEQREAEAAGARECFVKPMLRETLEALLNAD